MTPLGWSIVLQWSRVGITAVLFLFAARVLSLVELGLFATAFAPVRLTQSLYRAGIGEAVVVYGDRPGRRTALFAISTVSGVFVATALAGVAVILKSPLLAMLAVVPLISGVGAVFEGVLRREMRIRDLALRTVVCQSLAALVAFWMLLEGFGAWALACFAVLNAALSAVAAYWLAGWRPRQAPPLARVRLVMPKVAQIAVRDILNSGLLPVAQMLVAAGLGLAAAGAFQIAVRLLGLIDAVTLAPMRFTALPSLRRVEGSAFEATVRDQLRLSATIAAWVWGGTLAVTSDLVTLAVGATHAAAAVGPLVGLAGVGLISALTMPVAQAIMAKGEAGLVLNRAALFFGLGSSMTIGLLWADATVVSLGLSISAFGVFGWFLSAALPRLGLVGADLIVVVRPLAGGLAMVAALYLIPPMPLWASVVLGTLIYAAVLGFGRVVRLRVAL